MPVFRTKPSGNLTGAIRRLMQSSSDLTPLQEMRADQAAAQTSHQTSLAEKARAEVEAMRRAEADRASPELAAEYAGNAAGMDVPTSTRLSQHLRGVMEQPSGPDLEDARMAGNEVEPAPFRTAAPVLEPGQRRVFQSALASTIANRLGTGKTNAAALAQAGDRINETALTNQAANTASVPEANRIIAAVAGKLREPFKVGAQGQVLNEETGEVNEATRLARAALELSGARVGTERSRQGELGTRSNLNKARVGTEGERQGELRARAGLSTARTGAVERGETNRGGARVTPQQVERWASEVARKEWDTVPAKERKGMNYQQHLDKVRERFKSGPGGGNAQQEIADAHAAIGGGRAQGKDISAAVKKRFKERMGFDLPAPVKAVSTDDDDED